MGADTWFMRRHSRRRSADIAADFFPDEARIALVDEVTGLRDRLTQLEQQVLAQYTATAAYATIAEQRAEGVRAEARADLDRERRTLVGLMEALRTEVAERGASSIGGSTPAVSLGPLHAEVAALHVALERVQADNRRLREEVDRLQQEHLREEGWLATSGPAESLALR